MQCKRCNSPLTAEDRFCPTCGADVEPEMRQQAAVYPRSAQPVIPEQYQPLSPWAYFGLQLLYSIPIVGFIFLIIFSCKSDNINRRNFTRSYWCSLILVAVVAVVFLFLSILLGVDRVRY